MNFFRKTARVVLISRPPVALAVQLRPRKGPRKRRSGPGLGVRMGIRVTISTTLTYQNQFFVGSL